MPQAKLSAEEKTARKKAREEWNHRFSYTALGDQDRCEVILETGVVSWVRVSVLDSAGLVDDRGLRVFYLDINDLQNLSDFIVGLVARYNAMVEGLNNRSVHVVMKPLKAMKVMQGEG